MNMNNSIEKGIEGLVERITNQYKIKLYNYIYKARNKQLALNAERKSFNDFYCYDFLEEDNVILLVRQPSQLLIKQLYIAFELGEDLEILLNDVEFYSIIYSELEEQGIIKPRQILEDDIIHAPLTVEDQEIVVCHCKNLFLKALKICIIQKTRKDYLNNIILSDIVENKKEQKIENNFGMGALPFPLETNPELPKLVTSRIKKKRGKHEIKEKSFSKYLNVSYQDKFALHLKENFKELNQKKIVYMILALKKMLLIDYSYNAEILRALNTYFGKEICSETNFNNHASTKNPDLIDVTNKIKEIISKQHII